MADHLREGQERLGDRDVAPQRLGHLVRRPRLLGDQPVDLLGAALVHREALVDQRGVVGRSARRGPRGRSRPAARASCAASRCSGPAPVCRSAEPSSGRAISGFEEMCAIRWSAAIRIFRSASQKSVSEGLWPGRSWTSSERSRSSSSSPSCERARDLRVRAPAAEAARDALQREDDVLAGSRGGASAAGELVVRLGALAVARRERSTAASIAATSAPERDGDDLDEAEVVDVLVGEDHELEVIDRVPEVGSSWCSSSSSALPELGPVSTRVSGSSSIR